jgi:hypothetical protein
VSRRRLPEAKVSRVWYAGRRKTKLEADENLVGVGAALVRSAGPIALARPCEPLGKPSDTRTVGGPVSARNARGARRQIRLWYTLLGYALVI